MNEPIIDENNYVNDENAQTSDNLQQEASMEQGGKANLHPLASSPVRRGRLFVVSGPSGVGKDSLLSRIYKSLPGIMQSVSATTRAPRPGETDGVDYHFLAFDEFETQLAQGYFLEYARYGPDFYGTPRQKVEALRAQGTDVVLKIEVQGAEQIKGHVPDAIMIFITPPSLEVLGQRLRARGTDTETRILERLAVAQYEMGHLFRYNYSITNDDFDTALEVLCAIITAERKRHT